MKKIYTLLVVAILFFVQQPISILANNQNEENIQREYFSDGSFFEIRISETQSRSSKSGTKTAIYKDSSHEPLWYVTVLGSFSYNGHSATCTSASVTAGSYSDVWKISNKSVSKSQNSATATAIAKKYLNGTWVKSITKSVTLSCDKNGNLS